MILRALLLSILNALRTLMTAMDSKKAKAVKCAAHGPAHPWVRALTARREPTAPTPKELARPARAPLPSHLAALLANAPSIEPELLHARVGASGKPRPAPFQTFRSIAAHVRIYNPKPPAPDLRRATPLEDTWATRLQRAIATLALALAPGGPPRKAPS